MSKTLKVIAIATVLSLVLGSSYCLAKKAVKVEDGKSIKFDYTLKIDDQVVETTVGKAPLVFTKGANQIIPGLEKQLDGLKIGDEKVITVAPEDAYGQVVPESFKDVPKIAFPDAYKPQPGTVIQIQNSDNTALAGIVWEVKDESIVVNYNHPLAGKTLEFDVKVIDVTDVEKAAE
ncbi:MAG: peptidylprolyl isomerase [Candidatus Zapsychrus exili]|nr:peptidylprolyl isomerase [Candidatus Zapsychrus exili]